MSENAIDRVYYGMMFVLIYIAGFWFGFVLDHITNWVGARP